METSIPTTKICAVSYYYPDNPSDIPVVGSVLPEHTPENRLSAYFGFRGVLGLKINSVQAQKRGVEASQVDVFIRSNPREISRLPKFGIGHIEDIRILDLGSMLSDLAQKMAILVGSRSHTGTSVNDHVLENPETINAIWESGEFPNLDAVILTAEVGKGAIGLRRLPRLRFAVIRDAEVIEGIQIHGYPVDCSKCEVSPFNKKLTITQE